MEHLLLHGAAARALISDATRQPKGAANSPGTLEPMHDSSTGRIDFVEPKEAAFKGFSEKAWFFDLP